MKYIQTLKTEKDLVNFKKYIKTYKYHNVSHYMVKLDNKVLSIDAPTEYDPVVFVNYDTDANSRAIIDTLKNNRMLGDNYNYDDCYIISESDIKNIKELKNIFSATLDNGKVIIPKHNIFDLTAFEKFTGITDITGMDENNNIKNFFGCSTLKTIVLPKSIKAIGTGAFAMCVALNKIIIPKTVTAISDKAFLQCINLKSIEIPSTVKTLGDAVFAKCMFLSNIVFLGSVPPEITEKTFININNFYNITVPKRYYNKYVEAWPSVANRIVKS